MFRRFDTLIVIGIERSHDCLYGARGTACGGALLNKGRWKRKATTWLCEVESERRYAHCPRCGWGFPLDEPLELGRGGWSRAVTKLAAEMTALLPFAQASELL